MTGTFPISAMLAAVAGGPADWLKALADVAGKGFLILAAAFLLTALLRRASAAARHLIWCCAFAGLLVLPVMAMLLPAWRLGVLPARTARAARAGPIRAQGRTLPAPTAVVRQAGDMRTAASDAAKAMPPADRSPLPADTPSTRQPQRAAASLPHAAVAPPQISHGLPTAWAAGALVVLAWVIDAHVAAVRLVRRSTPRPAGAWADLLDACRREIGLRRHVGLRLTDHGTMPLATGVIRPVLLLPTAADQWPPQRRRVVVLHELAHVRRWDCLTQLLSQVACALHWFNPLAWAAARRLRAEQERACDDLVLLARGTRPSDYAAHLLAVAQAFTAPGRLGVAAAAMARPSQLKNRLVAVLDAGQSRRAPGWLAKAAAAVAVVFIVGPLASLRVTHAADQANRGPVADAAPAAPVVATPQARLVASVSGGTVELVGVAEHPSIGKTWRGPDGNPLDRGFVITFSGSSTGPAPPPGTRAWEFVIRYAGLSEDPPFDLTWATADGPLNYVTGTAARPATAGEPATGVAADPHVRALAATVPTSARRVTLRVKLPTGPWRTVAESLASEAATTPLPDALTAERRQLLVAREKELKKALGVDPGGSSLAWSGKQLQLDRMIAELQKINGELSGIKSRYETLSKDLEDGRTPAEVEKEINNSYWYLLNRQRVQDADIALSLEAKRLGEHHEAVIRLKEQRALYQEQLDQTRDELKSTYSDTMKTMLTNEINAGHANAVRVQGLIDGISKDLGQLNELMTEYRGVQERLAAGPGSASFEKATGSDATSQTTVTYDPVDADVRLLAVDDDGRTVHAATTTSAIGNNKRHTTASFPLPPGRIKAFRLEARPFEWVEFRDVSLGASVRAVEARKPPLRTAQDWAEADEPMKALLQKHQGMASRLATLKDQLGPSHPAVIKAREDLAGLDAVIARYLAQLNNRPDAEPPRPGTAGGDDALPTARRLELLQLELDRLKKQLDAETRRETEPGQPNNSNDPARKEGRP